MGKHRRFARKSPAFVPGLPAHGGMEIVCPDRLHAACRLRPDSGTAANRIASGATAAGFHRRIPRRLSGSRLDAHSERAGRRWRARRIHAPFVSLADLSESLRADHRNATRSQRHCRQHDGRPADSRPEVRPVESGSGAGSALVECRDSVVDHCATPGIELGNHVLAGI